MEALAALGLASNIFQFLDFTWRLTSAAGEIRNSASGATERIIEFDKICAKLSNLYSNLASPLQAVEDNDDAQHVHKLFSNSASDFQRQVIIQSHTESLQALASDCIPLCQQLLAVTSRLQTQGGASHRFKSFKVALRTIWDDKKIKDIEERLKRHQHAISLHFLPLIKEHTSYTTSLLQRLRQESASLKIEQANQFDKITNKALLSDQVMELLDQSGISTTRLLTTDDIDNIVNGISDLSFSGHDVAKLAKEQAFLRSLDFASRCYRHDDIPKAYKRTCEWMLDPSKQIDEAKDGQKSLLAKWLKCGNGTFWVSGKAGSGKSTLMKYIAGHEETHRSLEVWAGTKKLVIGSHYFWNAGAKMQKSQAGLYRSLLYDFLRTCPELIPHICPSRWASTKISLIPLHSDNWEDEELLRALENLIRLPESAIRYCIFIDGVDEYDGDHFELCQLLKELSCSSNVKCCISSRPWNVFEDALGATSVPRLNLHELTREDILVYAQSRLAEHPRWNENYFPEAEMSSIIESITERAQGVFLWVCLVGKSLHQGLFDGDTIRDLKRRLESLPSDLESFFRHIINQVDNLYHRKMAQLLLTAATARQSLDLRFYQTQEYEEEDADYALNRSVEEDIEDPRGWITESCRRRINARCGGLLEIRKERVEFLHRSVRDFLLTREMNDYLHLESGPEFNVNLSLLKIYVYTFRCWAQSRWLVKPPLPLREDQGFWSDGHTYANDAFEEDMQAASTLLGSIDDFCEHTLVVLRAGVYRYVAVKLKEDPEFFNSVFDSPLCTAMDVSPWSEGNMNIVRLLLENGADPNDQGWKKPWFVFLRKTCQPTSDHNFTKAVESSLFSEFLNRGAKVDVEVYLQHGNAISINMGDFNSPKLPITHFLSALFQHKDSYRLSSECMHILEDFYTTDSALVKLEATEALPILQSQLKQFATSLPTPGRLRFLTQLIQKLIFRWNQYDTDLKILLPSSLKAFPSATGATLSDIINNPGQRPQDRLRRLPKKRCRSSAEADAYPRKKFA
ncbi:hypothetical protein F5Y08DRAFT_353284 [Xylaria arbuscula]|nr:hypothetical protein F5Y08DRAFT_353284 [Xylaria arbuscula]